MAKFNSTKINPTSFSTSQLKFYAVLIPIAIFMTIPVIYLINQAFKTLPELLAFPPTIIAKKFTLRNFRMLFYYGSNTGVPMARYILNSVIVTGLTLVLTIFITVTSAYALSKKKFKGKDYIFKINQMALMFVPIAVAVPRYMIIVGAGMTNTWWAHILPLLVMPIGLFLMKQFIDQLPDSLLESARIDGANDIIIILKIVIPLTIPAISTISILTFQTVWNSVEASNNFITNDTMKTVSAFTAQLATITNPMMGGVVAAGGLVMFLPNLVIFIIMQSQVMNTMSHSGIK